MATDAQLVAIVDELGEEYMRGAIVRLQAKLEDGAPFDTGKLVSSISKTSLPRGAKSFNAEIRQDGDTAPHGQMLDSGTGIFGPKGRPITSKTPGKKLKFEVGGQTIFRTSVKGSGKHKGWWSKFPWDVEFGKALREAAR